MNNKKSKCYQFLIILTFIFISGCTDSSNDKKINKQSSQGKNVESEIEKLNREASNGVLSAKFELSKKYFKGVNVKKDEAKAIALLKEAASKKHQESMLELAKIYHHGSQEIVAKPKIAEEWYQKLVDLGNTEAMVQLSRLYESGLLGYKDESKSLDLLMKSANNGNPTGLRFLASSYFHGSKGLKKDLHKANELLKKAEALNDPKTNYHLSISYAIGIGAPKDEKKSFELAEKSAKAGNVQGQAFLCAGFIDKDDLYFVDNSRSSWCLKAANAGDKDAQYEVANLYLTGNGLPENIDKAVEYFRKSAIQGNVAAQAYMGDIYSMGISVKEDFVIAYAWYNLAISNQSLRAKYDRTVEPALMFAERNRNKLASKLTDAQFKLAQKLSTDWKVGADLINPKSQFIAENQAEGSLKKIATGTGFYVTRSGHIITNHHLVDGCKSIKVNGLNERVSVLMNDSVNDISLLKINKKVEAAIIKSNPSELKQGEEVVVYGYPLNSVLSSGGNITPGIISALTGLGNNINQIQITAPIQPGSSGSPLITKKGEVVGVVSMKLSDTKLAVATGQVAQNVNFAISGQTLKTFLDTNNVNYDKSHFFMFEKKNEDIAEDARKWSILLECWN